jgi:trehalose 6-phosphate synthase/phosphatase
VHDYHLLLVPQMLKDALSAELDPNTGAPTREAVVGLFVHTPFPSSEVFRCLPRTCGVFLLSSHIC